MGEPQNIRDAMRETLQQIAEKSTQNDESDKKKGK